MDYIKPFNATDPNAPYVNANPAAGIEGSVPPAEAFEHPQRELRHLIAYANTVRPGSTGTPTTGDLEQVRKAVEALIASAIDSLSIGGEFLLKSDAYQNMLFFPETVTGGGLISISAITGQATIAAGQEIIWRGVKRISTTSFTTAALQFATVANKSGLKNCYHLRLYFPGHANAPAATYPNGRFMLRDLADAAYNPGALDETSTTFDSKYDDMLVARITTNASNALTITAVRNKDELLASETFVSAYVSSGSVQHSFVSTINFGRTPTPLLQAIAAPGGNKDTDPQATVTSTNRYEVSIYLYSWPDNPTYTDSRIGASFVYTA